MKKLLCAAALVLVGATSAHASLLNLSNFTLGTTISNGSGGIFYSGGLLTDDFLAPLEFDAGASGGDFPSEAGLLTYDFGDPSFSSFDAGLEFFDITDVGFGGDKIQFVLDFGGFPSITYPTATAALLTLTSSDFSSPTTNLDAVSDLEAFFTANLDSFDEFAGTVTMEVQSLTAIPSPAPVLLLGGAFAGLVAVSRKKKSKAVV